MAEVKSARRLMRAALVWNEVIHEDEVLLRPRDVGVGEGHLFPLPGGVGDGPITVLAVDKKGDYVLRVDDDALGGDVWIDGRRTPVATLRKDIVLGPEDHGVITVGPVAIVFTFVSPPVPPPKRFFHIDGGLALSTALAALLFGAFASIVIAEGSPGVAIDPLMLDTERFARFRVESPGAAAAMTPSEIERDREDEAQTRESSGGGRARQQDRAGHRRAREVETRTEGSSEEEAIRTRVRQQGLLGALSGGGADSPQQSAISSALEAVPSVSDILAGSASAMSRTGRGSLGATLAGGGPGGGAGGPAGVAGDLLAGGDRPAEISAMGMARAPAPMSRMAREVQVSVMRGAPMLSNGFLSQREIDRVVRRGQANVRYCYESALQRQPSLAGRVVARFFIQRNGRVRNASIASSSLSNAGVEGCITRQIGRWRFPEPDGGEVQVEYPFIFGTQ